MRIIRGDNSWDTDEHDFRKVTLLAEDTNLHTTLQYEKGEEIDVSNWKLKDWEEAVEIYKYAEGTDYGQNEFTYLFLKHVGPRSEYLEIFTYRDFENKKKFGEYVYWFWFGIAEMSLYVNYEDIAHDAIADVLNAGGVVFDWSGKLHVWITPEANLWERII